MAPIAPGANAGNELPRQIFQISNMRFEILNKPQPAVGYNTGLEIFIVGRRDSPATPTILRTIDFKFQISNLRFEI